MKYEVDLEVTGYFTVVIEADNEKEALEVADDDYSLKLSSMYHEINYTECYAVNPSNAQLIESTND